jgi:hypothetical protein
MNGPEQETASVNGNHEKGTENEFNVFRHTLMQLTPELSGGGPLGNELIEGRSRRPLE